MREQIYRVFSQVLGLDPAAISSTTGPENTSGWDSLKHLNLVAALEEEFEVEFTDTEVVDCVSPAMAMEILQQKIGSR
ncbi:acyl carrier protein [bacterium]|nr:acyl carrier protein [bacterium]